MSLNGFQALDLIYLLTTIILSGLCLLLKKERGWHWAF